MNYPPWPITILFTRYSGLYEGADWVAFNDYPDMLQDAFGNDHDCMMFFENYQHHIGRGHTPAEAYDDLLNKIEQA